MQSSNCWKDLFSEAYGYSTSYLIFTIAAVIVSTFGLWLFEKPWFYKLVFKMSKHSNNVSRVESEVATDENESLSKEYCEISEITQEVDSKASLLLPLPTYLSANKT